MASDTDILGAIGRLQRSQPRNADTMMVCEELWARLMAERGAKKAASSRAKFDRTAYMRDYMRKRRAAAKARSEAAP